jgi:hypothetical protein
VLRQEAGKGVLPYGGRAEEIQWFEVDAEPVFDAPPEQFSGADVFFAMGIHSDKR